jgi:hypothetical protein
LIDRFFFNKTQQKFRCCHAAGILTLFNHNAARPAYYKGQAKTVLGLPHIDAL